MLVTIMVVWLAGIPLALLGLAGFMGWRWTNQLISGRSSGRQGPLPIPEWPALYGTRNRRPLSPRGCHARAISVNARAATRRDTTSSDR